MRIAYIAPYQGPTLIRRRPVISNLSLGAKAKVELIAELLHKGSHTVEILSPGEVLTGPARLYRGFTESELFEKTIPIFYSAAFPMRFLNGFVSSLSALHLFKARHRLSPFDLVMIYNLKPAQVTCANYALKHLRVPVVLEYEDDSFLEIWEPNGTRLTSRWRLSTLRRLLRAISGCLAGSSSLLSQVPDTVPKLFLPGVVSEGISKAAQRTTAERENWVVFSGTHSWFQGLEQLLKAWRMGGYTGWQLHIAGQGDITGILQSLAENDPSIVFHGVLGRDQNAELLSRAKITVVAYEVSKTRGFSFKTIECLGAGLHVITTRLSALEGLEPELKRGLTYLDDNDPETIAASLRTVIASRVYERTAAEATLERYGPTAVSRLLEAYLKKVLDSSRFADAAA
jgi:hypothetical protein